VVICRQNKKHHTRTKKVPSEVLGTLCEKLVTPVTNILANESRSLPHPINAERLKPYLQNDQTLQSPIGLDNQLTLPVECLPDNALGAVAKPLIESNDSGNDNIFQSLKLVGKKLVNGQTHYKMRWHNYPPKFDSWENVENLQLDPQLIENYKSRQTDTNINDLSEREYRPERKKMPIQTDRVTQSKTKRMNALKFRRKLLHKISFLYGHYYRKEELYLYFFF